MECCSSTASIHRRHLFDDSFLPQAVKIIREKAAASVSARMYVVTATGFILWAAFGSNLISLMASGLTL